MQGIEQIRARVSELDLAGARVDLTDGSMDAQVRRQLPIFFIDILL